MNFNFYNDRAEREPLKGDSMTYNMESRQGKVIKGKTRRTMGITTDDAKSDMNLLR